MRLTENLTASVNIKGVIDVDTVKGCALGMKAHPDGGCYGVCYAAKTAKYLGYDFTKSVCRYPRPKDMKEIARTVASHPATLRRRMGSFGTTAIIETYKVDAKHPIDAHMRNSLALCDELPATLLNSRKDLDRNWANCFKNICCNYATYYFDYRPFVEFIRRNRKARLFYLQNEYGLTPNGSIYRLMRERGYAVISNVQPDASGCLGFSDYYRVNMNLLLARKSPPVGHFQKPYGIIYFGTYRKDREAYFNRYLQGTVYCSTSNKNIKKFMRIGCSPIFIQKLQWIAGYETLNLFKYSIYIEDEYTHSHFNYLANRFYEALACNVVQFFDRSCERTIEESGIEFDAFYYVSSHDELKEKAAACDKDFERHVDRQKGMWLAQALDERTELIQSLQKILS